MALLALNLHEPPPIYPRRPLPPLNFRLNSANLSRGRWPFRGLIFSGIVHQAALSLVLLLPLVDRVTAPPPPSNDYIFSIDLNSKSRLVYFPSLKDKDDSASPKKETRPEQANAPAAKAAQARPKGLSYPGRQEIVSDPPNPTNSFQTILRPSRVNPPVIRQPVPLPNLIQMADAGPLPEPLPPKPEPTPLRNDLAVATPSQVTAQRQNVLVPNATAPPLPAPERPAEPATPLRPDLSVAAPTLNAAQRPKVVLPLSDPSLAAPERPIELTAVNRDLTIQSPAQAAPAQRQPVALPGTNVGPAVQAPERPAEPPTLARRDLAVPTPSAAQPQVAAVETRGLDRQNLISISPLPAPPQQTIVVPAGEARGRFAVSPDGNLSASTSAPGGKTDNPTSTPGGAANGKDTAPGANSGAASGSPNGSNTGARGGNSGGGNSGDTAAGAKGDGGRGAGTGTAAGNGTGNSGTRSPFPGITIQGGRLENGGKTGVVTAVPATPSRPVVTLPKPAAPAPNTAYGMTVVSTVGSGGGLPDVGVFSAEQVVYTVYLDMKELNGAAAPSWPLQYSLLTIANSPTGVVPPFPVTKESPKIATDLLRKYLKRMVLVYAVVNTEGKLQDAAVKQTPDPLLNQAVLAALSKWVFRPAQVNDNPVAVKVLVGIPLALP